jgi:hypothetical protein
MSEVRARARTHDVQCLSTTDICRGRDIAATLAAHGVAVALRCIAPVVATGGPPP